MQSNLGNTFRAPQTPLEAWAAAGLVQLAGLDSDGAQDQNGVGFNKFDTDFGRSLAKHLKKYGRLSTRQWGVAINMARKYRGQLPPVPDSKTAPATAGVAEGALGVKNHSVTEPERIAPARDPENEAVPAEPACVQTAPSTAPAVQTPKQPDLPILSEDQKIAHDAVVAWYKAKAKPLITLGGYAGTGKTFLTAQIASTLRREPRGIRIAFCCFTGKASTVLGAKLKAAGALQGSYCGTIHGLIYKPRVDDKTGKIIGWDRAPELDADLIVLDEASMVDEVTFKDLSSYGVPILAVGDHGQLPPVTGQANLMGNPELRLERIHRQAEANPIVKASMIIRETGDLPYGEWRSEAGSVLKTQDKEALTRVPDLFNTMVLAGTNRTRVALNYYIRNKLGFTGAEPVAGEKLICLKNNRKEGLFNGLLGTLKKIEPLREHHHLATVAMDGFEGLPQTYRVNRHQFGCATTLKGSEIEGLHHKDYGELFDWGYCLTVHKSQGSQAQTVVVFDDCAWMRDADDRRRWRYTAVTRAARDLVVIGR